MSEWNKWDHRFMQMAQMVGSWSSCYQMNRKIGAVIVKNKRVLTTGYNGAPSGIKSCMERGECLRRRLNIPSGTQLEKCYAVHSEENAIAQAARMGVSVEGATLYCTHQPCTVCTRLIINSGITRLVYSHPYPDEFARQLLAEAGIQVDIYPEEELARRSISGEAE